MCPQGRPWADGIMGVFGFFFTLFCAFWGFHKESHTIFFYNQGKANEHSMF